MQISKEVDTTRIASDVLIHAGSVVRGEQTSIGSGTIIGEQGPVVIDNCQIGKEVCLKGGFFKDAVILDGVSVEAGAHVREGTLLEEQVKTGAQIGFKQTILMPYVAVGSMINFCDVLMGGGTSKENHSEVGSSFVHFNYTPYQDKATPSLVGDVIHGIFLDQEPIFLGGQGGLVGPRKIAYGTISGAGTILRDDINEPNQLVISHARPIQRTFDRKGRRHLKSVFEKNVHYISELAALQAWYHHIRSLFVQDVYAAACLEGADRLLNTALHERQRRLNQLLSRSIEHLSSSDDQKRYTHALRVDMNDHSCEVFAPPTEVRDYFTDHNVYLQAMHNLPAPLKNASQAWLRDVAVSMRQLWDQ